MSYVLAWISFDVTTGICTVDEMFGDGIGCAVIVDVCVFTITGVNIPVAEASAVCIK